MTKSLLKSLITHIDLIQINTTVGHHGCEKVGILLIKHNVNCHIALCCLQKISKDINICENVHSHGNNLQNRQHTLGLLQNQGAVIKLKN